MYAQARLLQNAAFKEVGAKPLQRACIETILSKAHILAFSFVIRLSLFRGIKLALLALPVL